MRKYKILSLVGMMALGVVSIPASATDTWPAAKPITYIVPFSPGGSTDIVSRLIASKLGPMLGTNIIVVNKPGAGGNIGSEQVARSDPDGYVIGGASIATHSINTSLYKNLAFHPVKDFTPIMLVGTLPNVLIVNAKTGYTSVSDLVKAAKASPAPLPFASAGNGTSQHLSAELFKQINELDLTHIPYKGAGPAMTAVLAGEVQFSFENLAVASPHIDSGAVRALAVTSDVRSAQFPSVPTMQEAGIPNYDVVSWQALFAPADLDPVIQRKLNETLKEILGQPDVVTRMNDMGIDVVASTPDELAVFQADEIAKWKKVIEDGGIVLE